MVHRNQWYGRISQSDRTATTHTQTLTDRGKKHPVSNISQRLRSNTRTPCTRVGSTSLALAAEDDEFTYQSRENHD